MEQFILELGAGFTFVARQKRIVIDGDDFYLDLLFYHRKLRRMIAVELKLERFKAADKGQMELYLLSRERHNRYYAVFLIMPRRHLERQHGCRDMCPPYQPHFTCLGTSP